MIQRRYRAIVTAWITERVQEQLDEHGAADVPEAVDAAIDHFGQNQDFVRSLMHEIFRPAAYQASRQAIAATRGGNPVTLGNKVMSREEFERRAKHRFERWVVNVKSHRDVQFMDLERSELELWRNRNERLAKTFGGYVRLCDRLMEQMGDGERVSDLFTPEEVEEIYQEVQAQEPAPPCIA